jgi:hypothetical protein
MEFARSILEIRAEKNAWDKWGKWVLGGVGGVVFNLVALFF